ncbi:MAG: hypothetical protein K2Z81_05315 [Cyanobacteria bacterium]|nr:hypothetical protein [Cyanobacteriota bacterium]
MTARNFHLAPEGGKTFLERKIDRIVATATAPDARYRYASAAEVKKDLLELFTRAPA